MNKDIIKLIAERSGYSVDVFGNGYWNSSELMEFSRQMILEAASILNNAEQIEAAIILKRNFGVIE
jgi:hypothetical protein